MPKQRMRTRQTLACALQPGLRLGRSPGASGAAAPLSRRTHHDPKSATETAVKSPALAHVGFETGLPHDVLGALTTSDTEHVATTLIRVERSVQVFGPTIPQSVPQSSRIMNIEARAPETAVAVGGGGGPGTKARTA